MIKILIVAHGKLAKGFKDAVETVFGQSDNVEALGLYPDENINNFNVKISKKIESIDKDDSLVIFTDIVSASPYTQSQLAIRNSNLNNDIRLIGNTSFQMIMEAINADILDLSFEEAIDNILNAACQKVEAWRYEEVKLSEDEEEF